MFRKEIEEKKKKKKSFDCDDIEACCSSCDESSHCDCCETSTTEERYKVTIQDGGKDNSISVGDSVRILSTRNVVFNPRERTAVYLTEGASQFFVCGLLNHIKGVNDQASSALNEVNSDSVPPVGIQELNVLDLLGNFSSKSIGLNQPGIQQGIENPAFKISEEGDVVTDGYLKHKRTSEASLLGGSDAVTFEVHRTVHHKMPRFQRRRVNGTVLVLCAAFCTIPIAVIIIYFVFYAVGVYNKF